MRKRRVALTGPCSRPMAVLHMSVMPQRSMRQPSVRMFVSSGTWEIEEEERQTGLKNVNVGRSMKRGGEKGCSISIYQKHRKH